jgi:hypothetical protein
MKRELEKLRQIASRGDHLAALVCAVLAEQGCGVSQDSVAAEHFFKQAASEIPLAQFFLASRRLKRQDTAVEGFRLAERAAKAGLPEAAILLGHAYHLGLGTKAGRRKGQDLVLDWGRVGRAGRVLSIRQSVRR